MRKPKIIQPEFDFAPERPGKNTVKEKVLGHQEKIVFDIVKRLQPIRTERVKIKAMYQGCSCADRFLRWLQHDKKIKSYKKEGDKTKTWILGF